MPALQLFGHRTALAGDDLRFFAFFAFLFRLLQIAVLIPIFVFVEGGVSSVRAEECRNLNGLVRHAKQLMILYWSFSMILAMVAIILELLM